MTSLYRPRSCNRELAAIRTRRRIRQTLRRWVRAHSPRLDLRSVLGLNTDGWV